MTQEQIKLSITTLSQETLNQSPYTPQEIQDFLFENLGAFRDSKEAIGKAINFALSEPDRKKGEVFLCLDKDNQLVGVVVINRPGMTGYVPENFLVYIAVKSGMQGQGIGTYLFSEVFNRAKGSISLHVEHHNPAKRLYQKLGFTEKYAEMRLER